MHYTLGAIGKMFLATAVSTNVYLVDSKTQRGEETASTPLLVKNFLYEPGKQS